MISVCLASYNGEPFIEEQLRSILSQIGSADEVIVSDDGSTDRTREVVRKLGDPRIRLIRNSGERGYARNFEHALRAAGGEIIFLADQDDVWQPNKVTVMCRALQDADFVVSDATATDAKLKPICESHFARHHVRQGFWHNVIRTRYIGACMAFRRAVLDMALPFPANQRLCAHDYWLAILAEARFRVQLVHEPLLLYRRHGENASSGGEKSGRSLQRKLAVRFYCLFHLCRRLIERRRAARIHS